MDTFTGGTGNDAFNASVATLGAFDVVDGGAGTDTLNIVDTGAIATLGGASFKNIETVAVSAGTSVGTGAISAVTAAAAVTTLTEAGASITGNVVLNVGGIQVTATTGQDSDLAAAVTAALSSLGYSVVSSSATATQVTVAAASGVVTVTGKADGSALPTIAVVSGAAANLPAIAVTEGVTAVSAADAAALALSGVTGLTSATVTAGTTAYVSAAKTTDLTVTAGTVASVTGGDDVVATGKGGVTVKSATGSVTVTEKAAGAVTVEGGTTVNITKAGSLLSATTGQPSGSAYAGNITVGADASYSNTSATADGYPELDANVKKQPTGNVTIKNYTDYTNTNGVAARVYGTGTADVYANGATAISVATAGAITVKDVQVATRVLTQGATAVKGTQTLSSVTLDGAGSTAAVTSDELTSLKVVNTGASAAVTVTNAKTGGHALNLTLGNNASGTAVTDNTATSLVISTEAQAISTVANASKAFVDLNAAVATSLTFNNAQAVELTGSSGAALNGATKVTSIVATGAGNLTLNKVADATKLALIDASTATGKLSVTIPATPDVGMTVNGGSGNDTVTLDGAIASKVVSGATKTTTVSLGAGNDSVLKGTSGSIGAGAYVDGGEGSDTIAASLLTAGNSALIVNFETLGLDLGTGTYDTNLLAGATGLAMLARGGEYTGVEQEQGLAIVSGKATADETTTTTIGFTASTVTGSADAYTVTFAQSAPTSTAASKTISDAGVIVLAGIETINVVSGGTGFLSNHITVTGANARNVTLSGDQDLTIDFSSNFGGSTAATSTNGLGVATIDGSAMTGKLAINTANVLEAFLTTTITGGSNADTITLSALGGKAVVDAGAGADKIVSAAQSSIQTGGAGKDTFDVTLAVAMASGSATNYVTTIKDFAAGDVLDFIGGTNGAHSATTSAIAKLTLTTEATLADAITSALNASPRATATSKEVVWFNYGGDTYVTFDASDDTSTDGGMANGDIVVKLSGIVDLTTATFDATNGSVVIA